MRVFGVLSLVFASSLCLTTALQAQEHATDRGSFILGGSAGLSSQKVGGNRSTYMHLTPNVLYFVRPGLALGGTLSLSHSRYDEQSRTAYGVGPQISYYFGGGEQELRPYVSARSIYSDASGGDYGALWYGGNVGVLYLFTRSVGLDASLFYNTISYRGSGPPGGSDVMGIALGFSAFAF